MHDYRDPVRIPDLPGKISFLRRDDTEYVRYLGERTYNPERKYNEAKWIIIGRRCESMPGMMYPNDNYEEFFSGKDGEEAEESMTAEEQEFARNSKTCSVYGSFFDALYHEFRQQTRKRPDNPLNRYKAESLNRVLGPLREMMQGEEYAELLGPAEAREEDGEGGMSYSDAMILMTQYKSALAKYRRKHS